jgi:hypothetical protein
MRTGFATRGGTMRDHIQIQINHQRYQMLAALQCLLDEIGVDEYNIWVDEVITDDMSATEIIRIARAYLDELATCTRRMIYLDKWGIKIARVTAGNKTALRYYKDTPHRRKLLAEIGDKHATVRSIYQIAGHAYQMPAKINGKVK